MEHVVCDFASRKPNTAHAHGMSTLASYAIHKPARSRRGISVTAAAAVAAAAVWA